MRCAMQLETIQNKMGTFVTVLDRNKTQWQRNIKIVKEWGERKESTILKFKRIDVLNSDK